VGPVAFEGPEAFRAWLRKNHATARELLVRCFKVEAAHRGLTYRQALDEALCIGWIDGVRRALDAASFSQRFSPRKPKSAWSTVNIRRFEQLQAEGRVLAPGLAAFETRVKSQYSFESRPKSLAPAFQKQFRARQRAWRFYQATPPWYRRTTAFYVMSAKQPETRARRLAVLISWSDRELGIPPLKLPTAAKPARSAGSRRSPARRS
jgi:uncharacterized protein YdeI (YjbR/CyaY-like superfamily)